jgi:hypothetical protein
VKFKSLPFHLSHGLAFLIVLAVTACSSSLLSPTIVRIDVDRPLRFGEVAAPSHQPFSQAEYFNVHGWSGAKVVLHRDQKAVVIKILECELDRCKDSDQVNHLTFCTERMSIRELTALHDQICALTGSHDSRPAFVAWLAGDHEDLFRENWFQDAVTIHFGVHRSFNNARPWFAEIGLSWECGQTSNMQSDRYEFTRERRPANALGEVDSEPGDGAESR